MPAGALVFHRLPAPTSEDIQEVVRHTHAGLALVLARHGRSLDSMGEDVFANEEPVLASCASASAADLVLIGECTGQRTSKLGRTLHLVSSESSGSYAEFDGVNIHAGVAIDGRDRKRLERVCRYIVRPPLALERPADITICQRCTGRMRVIEVAKDEHHAARVLSELGIGARTPPPKSAPRRFDPDNSPCLGRLSNVLL
jgi:hypothetical protein